MRNNNYIKKFLAGIDRDKLAKSDENELSKFRVNIANTIKGILRGDPKERAKVILGLKEGLFELISQVPVVTPIVTAMLQAVTGEDLGGKIDNLIELQKQTLNEIADLKNLQRQTINLQRQTINLQKQTINLQKQTIKEIHKTIKEIHKLPEKIIFRKVIS